MWTGSWTRRILCNEQKNCPALPRCSLGVYFPRGLLFLITCSMSACSDVSSLMLYLARIFMMGLIFSHHCVLGMRWLQQTDRGGDRPTLFTITNVTCSTRSHGGKCVSYSKSVSPFRSARGWKVSALFLMPSTQAESGVLAKMRPEGHRKWNSAVNTPCNARYYQPPRNRVLLIPVGSGGGNIQIFTLSKSNNNTYYTPLWAVKKAKIVTTCVLFW